MNTLIALLALRGHYQQYRALTHKRLTELLPIGSIVTMSTGDQYEVTGAPNQWVQHSPLVVTLKPCSGGPMRTLDITLAAFNRTIDKIELPEPQKPEEHGAQAE
jgi:hypothetical protein